MNREKAQRHRKRKSYRGMIVVGGFVAVCVSVIIAILFALFGNSLGDIVSDRNYWLSVGVANGLLLVAFLLVYRIDAQNVALHENDLEDTEWLTTKRLKKLKEFTVTTWEKMPEHDDEIVIGSEKKEKVWRSSLRAHCTRSSSARRAAAKCAQIGCSEKQYRNCAV